MFAARAGKMEKWPPSMAKMRPIHVWYRTLLVLICSIVNARMVKLNTMIP